MQATAIDRSANLFRYFGWKGGTIHQVSQETGVSVQDLLYTEPTRAATGTGYAHGRTAQSACGLAYRLELAKSPVVFGNREFWLGVAEQGV